MIIDYKIRMTLSRIIYSIVEQLDGVVNVINHPCKLYVDWDSYADSGNKLGYSIYPNYVIIYAGNIVRNVRYYEEFVLMVSRTILHELYHLDQSVDYGKIGFNQEYTYMIESGCYGMTYLNEPMLLAPIVKQFIDQNVFMIDKYYRELKSDIHWDPLLYRRNTIQGHIYDFFRILDIYEYEKDLYNYINITMIINGRPLEIKYKNHIIVPVNIFNEFVSTLMTMGISYIYANTKAYYKDNTLIIDIHGHIEEEICV